jgi:cellulase/cellobiase CelA1
MEVQFKVGVGEGGTWSAANDPSYLATTGVNPGVPLYHGGVKIWGNEPSTTPDTAAPSVPGTPAASGVTSTGLTLAWAGSSDTGGSGLAGYDVYREAGATDVVVGSPTAATLSLTGLTAATTYQFYVVAVDAAGNASAASSPVSVTTLPNNPAGSCQVTYTTNDWNNGFTGNVTVKNTGTSTVNGWTLRFSFTAGQQVTQSWSSKHTQTGADVAVSNESWNGALAPGASTSFGFNATHTGSNPKPAAFTLNGAACTIG